MMVSKMSKSELEALFESIFKDEMFKAEFVYTRKVLIEKYKEPVNINKGKEAAHI